jgi:hypothetical protein
MTCLRQQSMIVALSLFMVFLCAMPICGAQAEARQEPLKNRWFFSFGHARNQQGVDAIESLIDTGAAHGLNSMVLSSFGLDSITRWQETDVTRLKEIQAHCVEKRIELRCERSELFQRLARVTHPNPLMRRASCTRPGSRSTPSWPTSETSCHRNGLPLKITA